MFNDVFTFLVNNPLLWMAIVIVCLGGAVFFHKQYAGMVAAEEIVRTQFNPADPNVLDELVEQAKVRGNEKYVLNVLQTIRQQYGRDGVKVGHIMWILHLVETGYPDINDMEIPSFDAKE
ncbi:hypothetical protein QTV44_002553 [Vibrio vulnificus]|nr:hypothetical protein [Vibrio vulnificus]